MIRSVPCLVAAALILGTVSCAHQTPPSPAVEDTVPPARIQPGPRILLVASRRRAEALGFGLPDLTRLLEPLGVPRPVDAGGWASDADKVVVGQLRSAEELARVLGGTLTNARGEKVPVEQVVEVYRLP